MKIKVVIDGIVIEVYRPFNDVNPDGANTGEFRANVYKDTVFPMLESAVNKAKELYELKHKNIL
ncbi:MAG: hypothetical protein AABY22_05790 [Nanoarchaeota archaeon]|mgnify:CR=1 FL=1